MSGITIKMDTSIIEKAMRRISVDWKERQAEIVQRAINNYVRLNYDSRFKALDFEGMGLEVEV